MIFLGYFLFQCSLFDSFLYLCFHLGFCEKFLCLWPNRFVLKDLWIPVISFCGVSNENLSLSMICFELSQQISLGWNTKYGHCAVFQVSWYSDIWVCKIIVYPLFGYVSTWEHGSVYLPAVRVFASQLPSVKERLPVNIGNLWWWLKWQFFFFNIITSLVKS